MKEFIDESKVVEEEKKNAPFKSIEEEQAKEAEIRTEYDKLRFDSKSPEDKVFIDSLAVRNSYKNYSDTLKRFVAEFSGAQINPEANMDLNPEEEGPKDYRDVLALAQSIIGFIDTGKSSFKAIGRSVERLQKLTDKYIKDHKPRFRGHRTKESAARYEIMERLSDETSIARNSINSLVNDANKNLKEAGKEFDLNSQTSKSLRGNLMVTFPEYDAAAYVKSSRVVAEHSLLNEGNKFYTKRILNTINERTSGLDPKGYLEEGKNIRSTATASTYDYAEAGIVMRELDTIQDDATISQLRQTNNYFKSNEFKKEVNSIAESRGFEHNLKATKIAGVKNNLTTARDLVKDTESGRKQYAKIINELKTKSVNELKKTHLARHKKIDNNLVYKIAIANMRADPNNRDIIYTAKGMTNYLSDERTAELDKKAGKELFEYIKKTGVAKDLVGKPLTKLPDLMKKMDDPKFQKGFANAARKQYTKQLESVQSEIRRNADRLANPQKYSKRELAEAEKEQKRRRIAEEKENVNIKEKTKRGAKREEQKIALAQDISNTIKQWNETGVMPKKMEIYIPNGSKKQYEDFKGLWERAEQQGYLRDDIIDEVASEYSKLYPPKENKKSVDNSKKSTKNVKKTTSNKKGTGNKNIDEKPAMKPGS